MLKLNKRITSALLNNGYFGGQIPVKTQKNRFVLPHSIIQKYPLITPECSKPYTMQPWYAVSFYINLDIRDSSSLKPAEQMDSRQPTFPSVSCCHTEHTQQQSDPCSSYFFLSDKIINTIIWNDYSFS